MKVWMAGAVALLVSGCSGDWVYERSLAYDSYADRPAVAGHAHATIQAAEIGQPVDWRSPRGGAGRVVPLADAYMDGSGRTCRLLRQEVTVRSATRAREAEACRSPDGTWVVIERPVES